MTVSFARVDRPALKELVRTVDEVTAVFLGPAPGVANEYQLGWPTRWGPLADALRDRHTDPRTVDVLESAVQPYASSRAARGATEVAAFAAGGRLLGAFPAPGATWPDFVRVSAPAHVYPLREWVQQHPAYVDVVVDRAGADIEAFAGAGALGEAVSVDGPDDQIENTHPGGFLAQGRVERRAEDSWKHNAGAVAARVVAALERVHARLLVVSGDVRAVQLLLERLPERVVRGVEIRQVRGSRSADGSQQARPALAAAAAREAADHQRDRLMWLFAEERAPGGLAVEGEEPTLAALAEGRVGTLLVVHPVVDDPRRAWFGPTAAEVEAMSRPTPAWDAPRQGPLLDVAVRSALLAGAEVRVVPAGGEHEPAEGLGGLCRYH